jgi:hypothetical protein
MLHESAWDAAKHPRGGFPQNRGWFSPTGATTPSVPGPSATGDGPPTGQLPLGGAQTRGSSTSGEPQRQTGVSRDQADAMLPRQREALAKRIAGDGHALQRQLAERETQKRRLVGEIEQTRATIARKTAHGESTVKDEEALDALNERLKSTESQIGTLRQANEDLRNEFNSLGLGDVRFILTDDARVFAGYDQLSGNEFQWRMLHGTRDGLTGDFSIPLAVGTLGASVLPGMALRGAAAGASGAAPRNFAGMSNNALNKTINPHQHALLRQLFRGANASGLTRKSLEAAAELSRRALANPATSAAQRHLHLRRLEQISHALRNL